MTVAAALTADVPLENPIVVGWEAAPRSATPTDAPVVSAEGLEGPLDWLVDMARAQKIDLVRLPIAALIQSFVGALETALARPEGRVPLLSRWGDWLVMAATLTQMRSRLLLPADAPEARAAVNEAEALRRQLLGRQAMRVAADWLQQRPQLGQVVFARGRPEGQAANRDVDVADLLRACLSLLRVPQELAETYRPRPPAFWRVSQAIARIEAMLAEQPEGAELSWFLPAIAAEPGRELLCRAALASTLVAGLELARVGRVLVEQEVEWGEMSIRRSVGS